MDKYYSFRVFVERFPSAVHNEAVYVIAEKISEILKCKYDRLGYRLLHPDYDFKEIGIMFPNDSIAHEKFIKLNIPTLFYGKDAVPAAPSITFELTPQSSSSLSDLSVVFRYPVFEKSPLIIEIDVNAGLISEPVTIKQYSEIMNIIIEKEYLINSAFLHDYSGNMKRMIFNGGQSGFCTFGEICLISKAVKYQGANYRNKLMDIFLINSISNKVISSTMMTDISQTVGESNVSSSDSIFTFTLPHSSTPFFMGTCKMKLRKLLEREKLIV